MNDGITRLLSDIERTRLSRLLLGSRFTVEGSLQGAHRSPLKGFSVEFADYRSYVSGDDLRHLDWRVFARNERLYVRQYEEECNLRAYLLVDGSASMGYGSQAMTKYGFASRLAAALAYVTVQQQDSVGATLFDSRVRSRLPARSGFEHLRQVANLLSEHTPSEQTDLAQCLHRLAQGLRRRALVVVISDLLDDLDAIRKALAHFRRRRHDVILYHVLDRAEIEFPFRDAAEFRDMETGARVQANPREIRRAYQDCVSAFLESCREISSVLDTDYALVHPDQDLVLTVQQHLHRRYRRRA